MKQIKSNNTLPEVLLRKKLWGKGFRFSRKVSELPGSPDIVLKRHKVAIFIDGEFWHGFEWEKKKKKIKANKSYWIPKIEKNMARDKKNTRLLRKLGWVVVRFWGSKVEKKTEICVQKLLKVFQKQRVTYEKI